MKISINPFRTEAWFGESPRPVLDLLAQADEKGIDAVSLPEHILMGANDLDKYPYAPASTAGKLFDQFTPFHETVVYLAAIAAVTKRMRLSTGVMLTPLRTATLLAKQLVTLDHISGGRVEIGIGVGWQRLEYDAEGIDWDNRFGRMMEIAQACKALWTQAPASFHGKHVNFDGVYSIPHPIQKDGIPQWFGVAPTERNIERMAQAADGWVPLLTPLDVVVETMAKIKRRMAELGRDPERFALRLNPEPAFDANGKPDLDGAIAQIPRLLDAGATDIDFLVVGYCAGPQDYERFIDKILEGKAKYSRGG